MCLSVLERSDFAFNHPPNTRLLLEMGGSPRAPIAPTKHAAQSV